MTQSPTNATYDVYISYSHADREWVVGWLLPRLEAASLHICIDYRDFDPGAPSLKNMERAVQNSRHTVLVLSPACVESEWVDFETLLTQTTDPAGRRRRLLPLVFNPCQPPLRIAMLTYLDFTKPDRWETELPRLVAAIRGELRLKDVGPQLIRLLAQVAAPFLVPFPRNDYFVGRDDDLNRLHALLQQGGTLVVRPAMLSGLGGIGKTQLAVEYAYHFQGDYPGGVYWVNAAADWLDELATLASRIGLHEDKTDDALETERRGRLALAFANYVKAHPDSLVIFDNVDDPRLLRTPLAGIIPAELKCRLLLTTRRRDPDLPFAQVEIRELSEPAALDLLLHTRARQSMLKKLRTGGFDPEFDAARVICKLLGNLPLALTLAAAYLGRYSDISLSDYSVRLEKEGGVVTLDSTGVDPLDLPTRHDTSIAATLKLQWDAVKNENARMVLQTAALLGQGTLIPRDRLAVFSGLTDEETRIGYPSLLAEALTTLVEMSLVEELTEKDIRLHPLVQNFSKNSIHNYSSFASTCITHLAET